MDIAPYASGHHNFLCHKHKQTPSDIDWKALCPYFGYQSEDVINAAYRVTSKYAATIPSQDYLKKHFKSRNPVFNIPLSMNLLPQTPSDTSTHCVDVYLDHDLVAAKAVTTILHFVNATPAHWYSKRQSTVETATFGSEFVAARTTVDQIIDLRATLMYFGVLVNPRPTCL